MWPNSKMMIRTSTRQRSAFIFWPIISIHTNSHSTQTIHVIKLINRESVLILSVKRTIKILLYDVAMRCLCTVRWGSICRCHTYTLYASASMAWFGMWKTKCQRIITNFNCETSLEEVSISNCLYLMKNVQKHNVSECVCACVFVRMLPHIVCDNKTTRNSGRIVG